MALDPAPVLTPPTIRQRSVLQGSSPARELPIYLPSESLTTSRVLVVLFTTISGGARSHIPTSQVWKKLPLAGANGYAQFGNVLVSAWLSRPGSAVYSAGSIQFAGLVGLAPEYATAVLFELQNCQNGEISLTQQTWDTTLSAAVTGLAPAIGQQARGVLAVAFTEGEHVFTEPDGSQEMQTQTAASGFFAAPFSVAGSYAGQTSNDPSPVRMPFTGALSRTGLLLFSATQGDSGITSPQAAVSTNAFTAYPSATITVEATLGYGGQISITSDAAMSFDPMTVMASSDADLFGDPTASQTLGTQAYIRVPALHTTSAALDVFNFLEELVQVEVLGAVTASSTGDTAIVNSVEGFHTKDTYALRDFFHLTNAYVFAGQLNHNTDLLALGTFDLFHLTNALSVTSPTSTHSTNAFIAAAIPPTQFHYTDTLMEQDAVIGMAGWELQDYYAEVYVATYYLAGGVSITTVTGEKRPGSLGAYGLLISNTGSVGTNSYVEIPQTSKALYDLSPLTDWPTFAAQTYRELWFSFWFRCTDRCNNDAEILASDQYKTVGTTPGPHPVDEYGHSWWLMIGTYYNSTLGGGLMLGEGTLPVSPSPDPTALVINSSNYPLSGTGWHLIEVRMYANVTLNSVSVANPMTVEVYVDGSSTPQMSINSSIPCDGRPCLGIPTKRSTQTYTVGFDDVVYSTRRMFNAYDLSVILKPAKADGFYTDWTGTPSDTYTDVDNAPSNPAQYFESATVGDTRTVKVYSGGDSDPYPGYIHAVTAQFVHVHNTLSSNRNVALVVREGGTDLQLRAFSPFHAEKTYQSFMVTMARSPVNEDLWVDSLYDFEIGVKQVSDSFANKVAGISASLLVSPFSYNHSTDAGLTAEVTSTHTTSAALSRGADHMTDALLKTIGDFHTTDTFPVGLAQSSYTTSATLSGEVDASQTTDIFIDRLASITTDTVVVEVRGSVHDTDVVLSGQIDDSHDADASIGALVDLPHETDLLIHTLVEYVHTTSSAGLSNPSLTHNANARTIAAVSATHQANGLLRATISSTQTTDALKYARVDQTHNTSAAKKGELSATHQTYAWTAPTNIVAQLHTTVASIRQSFTLTESSDALLKAFRTGSHTGDADLFGTRESSHVAFAWLAYPTVVNKQHGTNSKLIGEVSLSHTGQALLKSTFVATGSTDASLELIPEKTHSTNAVVYFVGAKSHSASSVLYLYNSQTHSADALLRITAEVTHTGSSKLVGEVALTHSSEAVLLGEVSLSVTTNALLKKTAEAFQTLNAALGFDVTHTGNSLIGLAAQKEQQVASSIFGEAQTSHTTSVLVYAQTDATHTTNVVFIGLVGVFHSTSGTLLGIVDLQTTSDALMAYEALFTTNMTAAGETGATHSTNALLDNADLGIFEPDDSTFFPGMF